MNKHILTMSINEIVCIGDEIFKPNLYSFDDKQYIQLIQNLLDILNNFDSSFSSSNLVVNAENIILSIIFFMLFMFILIIIKSIIIKTIFR